MEAEFILIRHGRSTWNDENRCQGSIPEPTLSAFGRFQARMLAAEMAGGRVQADAIYVSDQLRAIETAAFIAGALKLPMYIEPRLREMDQGVWQGMIYPDILAQYGDLYRNLYQTPFEMRPPGGESMREVAIRMITGLREIADKCAGQTAIIVSHEIPLAVVRCAAYGGDLRRMWDFVPQNCQPSLIRWPLQREVEIPGEIPQRLAA